MRIAYTRLALNDLRTIGDFMALDNRRRAGSFVVELRAACRSLQTGSQRYPIQSQWQGQGVRRMPVGAYLAFYRIVDDSVQILRVVHSAREIDHLELY